MIDHDPDQPYDTETQRRKRERGELPPLRQSYTLDAEELSTVRRAIKAAIGDAQADPDYAEDERAERLDRLTEALDALNRPVLPESIEWRVLVDDGHGATVEDQNNEQDAREWARLERQDYPRHVVTVERREVGAWESA